MIPLLLATLAVAMPVTCQPTQPNVAGYYQPRNVGGPAIVIFEPFCDDVRDGTVGGALLLAHELGHAYQDALRLPFDEAQADQLAERWWRPLWLVLGAFPIMRLER